MASDPRMPTGMSRDGFSASCAAVDTASKPMYAKNITPAPRSTPLHPNEPNAPVFGGTNGVRLARFTYAAPATTNTTSTATLMTTRTVFVFADSLMPTTSSAETSRTMTAAGALKPAADPPAPACRWRPASRARLTKYPDQPTATVDALSAYSRIRSHPMIHAKSSPAVAYAYV